MTKHPSLSNDAIKRLVSAPLIDETFTTVLLLRKLLQDPDNAYLANTIFDLLIRDQASERTVRLFLLVKEHVGKGANLKNINLLVRRLHTYFVVCHSDDIYTDKELVGVAILLVLLFRKTSWYWKLFFKKHWILDQPRTNAISDITSEAISLAALLDSDGGYAKCTKYIAMFNMAKNIETVLVYQSKLVYVEACLQNEKLKEFQQLVDL